MGQIFDPRWRAFGATGDAYSGATLTIYNANTLVLASVYSDVGLTTPLTNPVEADTNGRFPQVFAAEGSTFDIIEKDSSGNTLTSYVDVSCLGDDTGTFTRTLPDGTRFKVTGSGGRVLMQVGDPDPDATGGTLTIEGWAGTQGDEALLDFALINSTGRIKENSKKLTGVVYTEATSFSGSGGIVIPLPNDPTGVREWEIDLFDLQAAGTVNLTATASFDNGATYKSGAGDYNTTATYTRVATTDSYTYNAALGTAVIYPNFRTAANRSAWIKVRVLTVDSGAGSTLIFCNGMACDTAGTANLGIASAANEIVGGFGRITHLKLLQGANLISGKYRIIPRRGSGET